MELINFAARRVGLCLAAVLVSAAVCGAQDAQEPPKPEDAAQGAATATQGTTPVDDTNPVYPISADIRPAGHAVPWMGSTSPLRWGSFSINGFTFSQVRDDFEPRTAQSSTSLDLSILRTALVFDKWFRGQHLVLEYDPQLAVLNGDLATNAGVDNTLTLGTAFAVSPRFTITVNDVLTNVHTKRLFPADYFAADQQAGNVVQNNFLQNNGSFFMNQASVVFNYKYSPRVLLSFSPMYQYAKNINATDQGNYVANGHTAAGTGAITYRLTPRQNVGLVYTLQYLRANNIPGSGDTYFHSLGLFYSYQVGKNWWLRATVGGMLASYGAGLPDRTTITTDAALIRTFSHSAIAVSFGRGRTTGENFITSQIGERGDLSYAVYITRRLTWNNGGGYYRETGQDPRTKGNYGTTMVTYALSQSLSAFVSYSHTFQDSGTLQLLSGTRNTYFGGLKWQPGAMVAH